MVWSLLRDHECVQACPLMDSITHMSADGADPLSYLRIVLAWCNLLSASLFLCVDGMSYHTYPYIPPNEFEGRILTQ